MSYQVGDLSYFNKDDPEVETIKEARELAEKQDSSSPIGIWASQKNGSELLEIYYEGKFYR